MRKNVKGFTLIELLIIIAIVGILAAIVLPSFNIYGFMYSEEYTGELQSVNSAIPNGGAVMMSGVNSAIFSSAVMVKLKESGELLTFSTEDRQWATLVGEEHKGKCVTFRVFPYAPWNLSNAGTYHNGRLLSVKDTC